MIPEDNATSNCSHRAENHAEVRFRFSHNSREWCMMPVGADPVLTNPNRCRYQIQRASPVFPNLLSSSRILRSAKSVCGQPALRCSGSGLGILRLALLMWLMLGNEVLAEVQTITGRTMGTTYSIKWTDSAPQPAEIQTRVDDRLADINRMMSTYDPESELSRFNQSRSEDWFPVSRETALVVEAALEVSRLSEGAFDPTVGRLVRMWSFGQGARSLQEPPAAEIEEALTAVGFQNLTVQTDPPALRKLHPEVEVDLSGIAKGYGVDAVVETLQDLGIANAMVEIGGEVRTLGTKAGSPWTLGIERPETLQRSLYAKVELVSESLATSGDYRNFFEANGQRYSHTIDPRTGRPVSHQLASVSIIAADCMTADAWATAMMAMGTERSLALANELGLKALLLERTGETFRELASQEMAGRYQTLVSPLAQREPAASPLWTTFLAAAVVFGLAILGLAAGLILSNKTLKGSCGGASGMKDKEGRSICDMCTTPPEQCDQYREKLRQQSADGDADEQHSVQSTNTTSH